MFQVIGLLSFFHNFGQETGLLPFLLKYCPHLCKHSKLFQFKDLLVKGKHTRALRQMRAVLKTTLSRVSKGTGGRNFRSQEWNMLSKQVLQQHSEKHSNVPGLARLEKLTQETELYRTTF